MGTLQGLVTTIPVFPLFVYCNRSVFHIKFDIGCFWNHIQYFFEGHVFIYNTPEFMFLYHRILVKYVNIIPTLQLTHDKLQAHFIENETSFPPRDIILHVYFSNTRVTRDRVGDTLSSGFQRDFLLILVGNEFYGRQNVIKFFIKLDEIIKNAFWNLIENLIV